MTRRARVTTSSTGDPRLDNNPFFHERMRAGVDKLLAARGYERARGPRADMLVHYHASVSQRLELNDSERSDCVARVATGTEAARNCTPYVYDAGTLMIDVVDGRTSKLLWRGWAEGSMEGVIANQKWMEKRIDESLQKILEKLPRRL